MSSSYSRQPTPQNEGQPSAPEGNEAQRATPQGWKAELAALLKARGRVSATGTRVLSTATLEKRSEVLFGVFRELRELGYRLPSIQSLGGRHLQALFEAWKTRGLSASEFQTRVSILRTFCKWIGKPGMVDQVVPAYRAAMHRGTLAREDKSWTGRGIEPQAVIARVAQLNERVAAALELQRVFGLRVRESLWLRPHLADRGTYLDVSRGTKGGRERVVRIETPEQRAALDWAKRLTQGTDSLGQGGRSAMTWRQVRREYYYTLERAGVTRAQLGVTSHGLRHQYANDRFEALTGRPSPVRGGEATADDQDTVTLARWTIAEDLGHSRESVSSAYLGRERRP